MKSDTGKTEPPIVISGYYGFENFGDEIALDILVKAICNAGSGVGVLCKPSKALIQRHQENEIKLIDKTKIRNRVTAIRRAELIILGPGGLIKRPPNSGASGILATSLFDVALCRAFGVSYAVHSIGVGDLRGTDARIVRYLLAEATSVSARDQRSLDLLRSLGVPRLSLVDDSIKEHLKRVRRSIPAGPSGPRRSLGVAPSASDTSAVADIRSYVAGLSARIAATTQDYDEIVGIVSQGGEGGDTRVLRLLQSSGTPISRVIDLSEMNIETALDAIATCSHVVTSRYHIKVVCDHLGVPYEAVGKDPKLFDEDNPPDQITDGLELVLNARNEGPISAHRRPHLALIAIAATAHHRLRSIVLRLFSAKPKASLL